MRTKRVRVNKLKRLKINRVDTVDRGAQPDAHIVICKRYEPPVTKAPVVVAKNEPEHEVAPLRTSSVVQERIAKAAPESASRRFYEAVDAYMKMTGEPIAHATLAIAREDPTLYGEVQAEAPIVMSNRQSMT